MSKYGIELPRKEIINMHRLRQLDARRVKKAELTVEKINELKEGFYTKVVNGKVKKIKTDFYKKATQEQQEYFNTLLAYEAPNLKRFRQSIVELIEKFKKNGLKGIVEAPKEKDILDLRNTLKDLIKTKGKL